VLRWNHHRMSDRDAWLEAFPDIIRREREKSAFTNAELAERLELDVREIDSWEGGEALPTLPQFFVLAQLFGWPIPRLIVEEGLTDPAP
jgi:ribosome-binding protein aMBF1 (putative translation factor)